MKIHSLVELAERAENVIKRRNIPKKYRNKLYYHIGDYALKSSAESVVKDLKKMGYLTFKTNEAYYSDINPDLKYSVYAKHSAQQIIERLGGIKW